MGKGTARRRGESFRHAATVPDTAARARKQARGREDRHSALLARVEDAADLEARAEHIVLAVRALRVPLLTQGATVTVSIGGGMCIADAEWSAWYSQADQALYRAKGDGSNTWHISQG